MTRPRAQCRRCGLTLWPSCPARSPRLMLERAEGGLPVIEPVIEGLDAVQLCVRLEGLADFEDAVHSGRVPVGFQHWAIGSDLVFQAARSYSLMRPPRTARRSIRSWERSAGGWSGRGGWSWRPR